MDLRYFWTVLVLVLCARVALGWGSKNKIKLSDIQVLTLHQNAMTNGRRSSPVPQAKCVGGTAGCYAFVPKVIQCYNRGSDGYDVQWECKADMDKKYRFGEIAVNCEGYDYPDDPYVLKGSCGVEYTIDRVDNYHDSSYDSRHQQSYHGNYGNYKKHHRSSSWIGTLIMWGVIALIAYYIYSTVTANHNSTDSTQSAHAHQSASPPPPGFRPEYTTQDQNQYQGSTQSSDSSSNSGGFWTGMGLGSLAGYLFGSRGYGNAGYYNHHYPTHHGNSWFGGGNGWFGGNYGNYGSYGNHGNTGWFGNNHGNSGWFGSGSGSSSSWSGTHRRSGGSSSSSSSGSRTASGFGGTKRR